MSWLHLTWGYNHAGDWSLLWLWRFSFFSWGEEVSIQCARQGGTCSYHVYLRTVCFPSGGRSWFQLQFLMLHNKPGVIFSLLNLFILIILKRVFPNEYWHKLFWAVSQCFVAQVRLSLSIYFNTFVVQLQIAVVRYLNHCSCIAQVLSSRQERSLVCWRRQFTVLNKLL